jgi:hypothetical protein
LAFGITKKPKINLVGVKKIYNLVISQIMIGPHKNIRVYPPKPNKIFYLPG